MASPKVFNVNRSRFKDHRLFTPRPLSNMWVGGVPNFRCCFPPVKIKFDFRRQHVERPPLACQLRASQRFSYTNISLTKVVENPTRKLCEQSIYRPAKVFLCSTSTCWVDEARAVKFRQNQAMANCNFCWCTLTEASEGHPSTHAKGAISFTHHTHRQTVRKNTCPARIVLSLFLTRIHYTDCHRSS